MYRCYNNYFVHSTGVLFNLLSLPILYHIYFKKKQNTLWILLTTLALSDIVEIVIYFSTYSLLYHKPWIKERGDLDFDQPSCRLQSMKSRLNAQNVDV